MVYVKSAALLSEYPSYDEMFERQGGLCAICDKPETRLKKNGEPTALAVDHDHRCCPGQASCGKCVRGLVCNGCNYYVLGQLDRMMARYGEERVATALSYIKTHLDS